MRTVTLFTTPWCGPCKAFKPLLQRVTDDLGISLSLIDAEENPEAAAEAGIRSIPSTIISLDGEEIHRHSGTMPESKLRELLS